MAGQVKVDAALFASYDWSGRTIKNHRAQIRNLHSFREPTMGDEDKLADWLADKICPVEMSRDRLRSALLTRCREDRIEPPKTTRIERVLGAAESMFERQFTETTVARLSATSVGKLQELIVPDDLTPDSDTDTDTGGEGATESEGEEQAARAARRAFLQDEHENMMAATRHAAEHGMDAAWRLPAALTQPLRLRHCLTDTAELHTLAATAAEQAGKHREAAVAHHNLGAVLEHLGRYPRSTVPTSPVPSTAATRIISWAPSGSWAMRVAYASWIWRGSGIGVWEVGGARQLDQREACRSGTASRASRMAQ
ncbi:hypothetical protein GCM10010149_21220 [Nonomuraea roseoviolacea subsp. roseoviolacea]|uniref:DUF4158 domain-containing protein n=1 Tax=Nonomuraea roseoviolacea subsp. carminata TaxID=160689 RepID=A0ABT1KD33_9ACTN|nr:hypothetical protein [Nonomuraea roseoviolacea subsp. carminata]